MTSEADGRYLKPGEVLDVMGRVAASYPRITSEQAYQSIMGRERCRCGSRPTAGYEIGGVPTCEHCWEAATDSED